MISRTTPTPIAGLAAGTKHYYIVRAVNDQGPGKWSDFKAGMTAAAARPDAPEMTATTRDTTSIQLTWTVPNLRGTAGTVTYVLERWNGTMFVAIPADLPGLG